MNPKKFEPKPDITTYELALIVKGFLDAMIRYFSQGGRPAIVPRSDWPEEVLRHFKDLD